MNAIILRQSYRKRIITSLFFLLCFVLLSAEVSTAQTKIILKEKAVVTGPGVTLGEIADIEGGPSDLINKIKNIRIMAAPPPAILVPLQERMIEYRLIENGLKNADITIVGASTVSVYLDTVIISGEQFIAAAREYLEKNVIVKNGNKVVEFFRVPSPRTAAKRDLSIKVNPVKIGRLKGIFPLYVGIYNGDKLYQSVPVQANVRTFESIVVASRILPRGTVITAGDLKIINDETTKYNNDLVFDKADLVGKETTVTINIEKPVRLQDVASPTVIKRGDNVDIEVTKGGIIIKCKGVANRDGRIGDIIPVTRVNTHIQLQALVVSGSKVTIK